MGEGAPTAVLGTVYIKDAQHIGIEIDPVQYYSLKNAPDPSTVQTSYTAKVIDANHRDLFVFTESGGGTLDLCNLQFRLQSSVKHWINRQPDS